MAKELNSLDCLFSPEFIPVRHCYSQILTANGEIHFLRDGKLHSVDDQPAEICPYDLNLQAWYKDGVRHRDNDLPAETDESGFCVWYQNGKKHRDNDLPAMITDGIIYWYFNDLLHRDNDLPAIIHSDGAKEWYKNGQRHRDNDLPSVELSNGYKAWYHEGQIHRDRNKPAIIYSDGSEEFWEYNQLIRRIYAQHSPEKS